MSHMRKKWDQKLGIHTIGRDAANADAYRYPYEPTPYAVLERLAESGYISEDSVVADYGCGRGRVGFFLGRQLNCSTIGIEYDPRIFAEAMENQKTGVSAAKTQFISVNAEDYVPDPQTDCCYFFNPFSVEILHKVMARIRESYYENPRDLTLFFYYPSDEYVSYLMTVDELNFVDEIDCSDLFEEHKDRERILIFEF